MTEAGAGIEPAAVESDTVEPAGADEARWYQQSAAEHPAASVLLVGLMVAFPILVFSAGSSRWFYLDEWDFLAARSATNLGDLFRPHNENWSTIPILLYRGIFNLFHLHAYWPYQVPVVAAHLCVVGLLWIIMRRSGVNQWVALLGAAMLLCFGSGYENIVWAFQIGFTGALAFGLGQLLAADHDGPIAGRDWLGLGLGLGALLCSSVGVTTVAVVGVAALLRRGWRAAAFHVVPLGLVYGVWALIEKPQTPQNPLHQPESVVIRQVGRWDVASVGYTLGHLGHYRVVGVALGLLIVVGLALAWTRLGWSGIRRRQSMVVATLVGFVAFVTLSGTGRWFFGTSYAASSRYLYLGAAFLLPALGVAATTLIRQWRPLIPVVVLVMVAGIPGNLDAFGHQAPGSFYAGVGQQSIASLADSPLVSRIPPSSQLALASYPGLTAGWLAEAGRHSWMPRPRISVVTASVVPIDLGLIQADHQPPAGGTCQIVSGHLDLPTTRGYRFWEHEPVQGNTNLLQPFQVIALKDGKNNSFALTFQPSYGNLFTVALPGIPLRIRPVPGSVLPLSICH
jgi:hypothetical protein